MITPQTRKHRTSAWRAAEAAFAAAVTGKAPDFQHEAVQRGEAPHAPRREGRRPILGLAKSGLN